MNALIQAIPKGFWSADWRHNFINALPMGVLAIANHCNRRGHRVRVANAAVHGDRQTALDAMLRTIRDASIDVVGMPLHWHLSGYDVLRTAEFLKEAVPGLRVVLGGLTASVYPEQLLACSPSVDAVIVGDGEEPFCQVLDSLQASHRDADLSRVPNLVWRDGDLIRRNPVEYVASADELSALDFSPQASLTSLADYANGLRLQDAVKGIRCDLLRQPLDRRFFFMNIGRGCSFNCVYCGGSRAAHECFTGRKEVTIRSRASVVADFARCHAAGFRRFHICFDPVFAEKEQYFAGLFSEVRRVTGGGSHLLFEAYGLPSRAFLEAAARAFSWVGILISPCFFDAALRRTCKGYQFTDEEMESAISEIRAVDHCEAFVYFAVTALEDWSDAALAERLATIRRLRSRTNVEVSVLPIFLEPGSPWVSFPGLCGERRLPFSFEDFLREWRQPLDHWNDRLTGVEGTDRIMLRFEQELAAGFGKPRD